MPNGKKPKKDLFMGSFLVPFLGRRSSRLLRYTGCMQPLQFSPAYRQAIQLSADLFREQTRKISGVPYVAHVYGVSAMVMQYTGNENVWIGALLHDVLEDIDPAVYGAEQLKAAFGDEVYQLVATVTHDEQTYGKDEARRRYLEQLRQGPPEACLISAADMVYNANDYLDCYRKWPDKTRICMQGDAAGRRQWFWRQRLEIVSQRLGDDHALVSSLKPLLAQLEEIYVREAASSPEVASDSV